MNSERPNDLHRAIGSDVLAAECVEHIPAADSALPDAAIPIVVCSENIVFRENDTSGSHNVVGGFSIKNECFSYENHPPGECRVSSVVEGSCVANTISQLHMSCPIVVVLSLLTLIFCLSTPG